MKSQPYSREEILVLHHLDRAYGPVTYCNPTWLEQKYFEITGKRRRSGPLYMCAWRIRKGFYNHMLM